MAFSDSHPWKLPHVTTAESDGETTRLTMLWRRTTIELAMTIGSMQFSGWLPCPLLPWIVTLNESAADSVMPEPRANAPAFM